MILSFCLCKISTQKLNLSWLYHKTEFCHRHHLPKGGLFTNMATIIFMHENTAQLSASSIIFSKAPDTPPQPPFSFGALLTNVLWVDLLCWCLKNRHMVGRPLLLFSLSCGLFSNNMAHCWYTCTCLSSCDLWDTETKLKGFFSNNMDQKDLFLRAIFRHYWDSSLLVFHGPWIFYNLMREGAALGDLWSATAGCSGHEAYWSTSDVCLWVSKMLPILFLILLDCKSKSTVRSHHII